MRYCSLFALSSALVFVLAACSQVAPTPEGAVSPLAIRARTNATDATVDNNSATRSVTFVASDFPAGAVIDDISVALQFSREDYSDESYYVLTSPEGTRVVLVESYNGTAGSGQGGTYNTSATPGEIIVTFDDTALAQNNASPANGTFAPRQPLSAFKGESPFGAWVLTVGDNFVGDPLYHSDFSLALSAKVPDMTFPEATIVSPGVNATYQQGEHVLAVYSCADNPGGSGLKSCVGDLPNGTPIDTSVPGTYEFTVTATDIAGYTQGSTVSYTVEAAPIPDTTYTIDLETARLNQVLTSLTVGRGISGPASPDIVSVNGKRMVGGKLQTQQAARAVELYGSKRLTLTKAGTNIPHPNGGILQFRFGPFESGRADVESITLSNVTKPGAVLSLYRGAVKVRTISVPVTAPGASVTLSIDEPNLTILAVNARSPFAVDDLVFEVTQPD